MPVLLRALFVVVLCWCSGAWGQTTIDSFTPDGQALHVRQAVARFSKPIVAFGDARAGAPFTVDCPVAGSGRWLDAQTWAYDFERDLPGATVCRFALQPDLRDLAGGPVGGRRDFKVLTGGPAILDMAPHEGSEGLDEHQAFLLALSAPAGEASIAAHAWCRAEGVSEKIGVSVLHGDERVQVLGQNRWFIGEALASDKARPGNYTDARLRADDAAGRLARLVVLQCRRTLPANADIALVWGAGVAAPNGVATDKDQTLPYKTRPDFTARFACERVNARAGCIPFQPMRVEFSAPVKASDAAKVYMEGPKGVRYMVRASASSSGGADNDPRADATLERVQIPGPFPEQTRFTLHLPPDLHDDAGRALVGAARFPLAVRTGEQPPLVKFAAPFGILEAQGDRMLPVTVRNVEATLSGKLHSDGAALRLGANRAADVLAWLRRIAGFGLTPREPSGPELERSIFKGVDVKSVDSAAVQRFALPKPNGRRAFEVIGIPLRQPGFYAVELSSPRLGAALNPKGTVAFVRSAALVTNMTAHFKHGATSSLVWVTSLDKAQPVAGARVEVRDCAAKLLWGGVSDAAGVAAIRQALPPSRCKNGDAYFITAARGDDFTFTLSDWQQGIESWRFHLNSGSRDDDSRLVATVFDRTLLRAGETVHMKHFLRRHTPQGFALVRASDAAPKQTGWRAQDTGVEKSAVPERVFLIHEGSGEKTELPLTWNANGSAANEWTIPRDAKLGSYDVMIGGLVAGSFRVEQFRVPTMKAALAGPALPAVAPQAVTLEAQVGYLAGGPAGNAPVKLRSVVQDMAVQFPGYEDFTLGSGDVREGVVQTGDEGGAGDEMEGDTDDGAASAGQDAARTQTLQLDRAGGARIVVDGLPKIERPKSLLAELSYQDANGETLTASTHVALWPTSYVVGLKPDGWMMKRDGMKFQAVVLDTAGKPAAGVQVTVDILKRITYSHRRRLVGGFYAYENSSEIKRLGEACSGVTDAHGLLNCTTPAPAEGDLILRARAGDPQGRVGASYREVWVAGREEQWFAGADHDRIDLLPAQKRYEPGQEASFQVRSSFRRATVLVTVEREGILDTYVRRLGVGEQSIRIPVKANYAPNVFVSALVVRGRVAGVQPTALVDLGKPAYKLGIAPIQVGWGAHELKVEVAADKPIYKVRERAQVKIRVHGPNGAKLAPGSEVAVAAVDAGLLELMPNDSWKLLETMMRERSLQVETATAQMQVVGKRHFGRKAFPHGGGGGRSAGRELFDTLLLWRATVTLDANGEARVEVPLNDALTTFRIVAVASGGAGQFGMGGVDIRSTQDVMLLSGLPPVVRGGDRLRAGFTVRNASDRALSLQLGASVAADGGKAQTLARQDVQLASGASREIGWDYQAPVDAKTLQWEATVIDAQAGATDRIRIKQQVERTVPVTVQQSTLVQLDGPQTLPVARPPDALPGQGGIRTTLQARLGSELPGVRDYMAAYPFTCFEQRTSRAVALRDRALWETVVATLPAHLDGDGLVKYFATMQEGSDVLTAYVLSLTNDAGYAIPDDLKSRMEAALAAFVEGKIVRGSGRATGDLAVRKLAALEALSRSGAVRPAMLESIALQPDLWPTSAVIDWYLVLKRTNDLPQRDAQLAQANRILHARLHLQGATLGFSTERTDEWWWLMTSGDVNANRLLLATLDDPAWKIDAGRLARGALGRQHRGHWDTTTANAWGVVALDHFGLAYEREAVSGNASVVLAGAGAPATWSGAIAPDKPTSVLQAWPTGAATLTLRQLGAGKPWATVQSLAAIPLTKPQAAGYRIARTVTPIEQKTRGAWSRGDVYRVHLDIDAQADMGWVVVDDPIPAGASILGSGLGGDSRIATGGQRGSGWTWPAFEERTHTAFRSYFEWVPKGRWSVEYTVRLNNEGRFALPPTRVEAMYDPDMFGMLPNAGVAVGP